MFFSRPLLVVYKNTGGRLWNKPFGLPPLTKTQKRTRQKNVREVQKVVQTLKEAADAEPAKVQAKQASN